MLKRSTQPGMRRVAGGRNAATPPERRVSGGSLRSTPATRRVPRFGFTLVEMLVAVALVMLIMVLLASVFSLAASTATKQKGTAENDQQARTFTTIIQGDICARTFRKVIPFHPLGTAPLPDFTDADDESLELRRGYFCISENNPDSQKDDSLSFTVNYESIRQNCVFTDTSGIRARAVILGGNDDAFLFNNPNQPEGDDGFPFQNESGSSTTAEICYFLRDGNLHRRVMLLRDQYAVPTDGEGQPADSAGNDLVTGPYPGSYSPNGTGVFWRDFDYSALYHFDGSPARPWFLIGSGETQLGPLTSSLDNNVDGSFQFDFDGTGAISVPLALGIPHFRFGHDVEDRWGRAREFLNTYRYNPSASPPASMGEHRFIGRFTTQETAHSSFTYPGNVTNGNPMNPGSMTLNDADNNGVVDEYENLNRRGDDILLTNVIEFDVKVWDDVLNQFVDLGHSARDGSGDPIGHFNIMHNRSFDDADGDEDLDGSFNATTQRYELTESLNYGNTFDTWHWRSELGQPPYRPGHVPGNNGPDLAPGEAGVDEDGDGDIDFDSSGNPDPDEQGWIGTDDEVPLKAIEITIRYTDPGSGLVRQVTLLNSLLD